MTHSIKRKMLALALALSSLSLPLSAAGKPGDGSGGGTSTTNVQIVGPLPLPVVDVNDGFQPVQAYTTCHVPLGGLGCSTSVYSVPLGKRLVIEYYSGDAFPPAGQSISPNLLLNVGGLFYEHHMPLTLPAPTPNHAGFDGGNKVSWGQQVRLYADPGTSVVVSATRSDPTAGNLVGIGFTISGYLVDIQ